VSVYIKEAHIDYNFEVTVVFTPLVHGDENSLLKRTSRNFLSVDIMPIH
jgi:hypothetical protein